MLNRKVNNLSLYNGGLIPKPKVQKKMTYSQEKLMLALYECFAIGEGDARDRLSKAFQYFLFNLREEHFSIEHWSRFNKVKVRLTKNGPLTAINGEVIVGSFENGKNGMKNKTASKLIRELVMIYRELNA